MNDRINTNLIEANIKLVDENNVLKEDKMILQNRINKAIKTLENDDIGHSLAIYNTLKILKGEYINEQ